MDIFIISQFLFFFGFLIMVINETPVVLRHVFKPAMDFRKKMESRFGDKWHYWHKIIDYFWNFFLFSGLLLSIGSNFFLLLSLFLLYWIPIFLIIYLPLILKKNNH